MARHSPIVTGRRTAGHVRKTAFTGKTAFSVDRSQPQLKRNRRPRLQISSMFRSIEADGDADVEDAVSHKQQAQMDKYMAKRRRGHSAAKIRYF